MKLIANKAMRYKTRRMQAGDEFEAKNRDARIFVIAQLARYAPDDQPKPAPVAMPEPAEQRVSIDDLRDEAERLGIDVDGRWGVIRLQNEIARAKL